MGVSDKGVLMCTTVPCQGGGQSLAAAAVTRVVVPVQANGIDAN
jgi:hypothetical protein